MATLLIAAVCYLLAGGGDLLAAPKPVTPEQEHELKTLTGQLADPSRSAKTKAEAAELLLAKPYLQATEALQAFLADAANRPAQISVAEAVARLGTGAPSFIEPLLAMLTGPEPTVRAPAAQALVTYKNNGVAEKLISIAGDSKADKAVRLVTITALQRLLNKQAVDALVGLLGDRDPAIQAAASEALAKLTNIRAFGTNARKWRAWWERSKNKPASEWLADLADSLAREKARLEGENGALRKRLATAMMDLYTATAEAERGPLVLGFLKDLQADVRLVGVKLTDRRLVAGGKVGDDLRAQIRVLLDDADPEIRRSVALLAANVGDRQAVEDLLQRFKVEDVPEVREGLVTALGQFSDPNVVPAVLSEVVSKYEPVAAAAAGALARIASRQPLEGKVREEAVHALQRRHVQATSAAEPGGDVLREALLTAMGTLADKQFVPTFRKSLADPAATVRLAAVKGLAQLRQADLSDSIAALTGDKDRGVRLAVIDALGTLGGLKHLQTILQRTDAAVEPDAAVRQKAWTVTMAVLAKADAPTLTEVVDSLADRKEELAQRIQIMEMLVASLKAGKNASLPQAQRKLAAALMEASRPAEAAPLLKEAHLAHVAAKSPQAQAVWLEWIDARLGANDPMAIKEMSGSAGAEAFGEALGLLMKRLTALMDQGRYAPAILLSAEAIEQLPAQLADPRRQALEKVLADARAKQVAADQERVSQLAAQLMAADAAARKSAADELKAMGTRAVAPLVRELKKTAGAAKPNPDAEKALLDALMQIAPKLTGYDPKAPLPERLDRIDSWLKVL